MVRFNSAAETLHAKSVVVTDADVTSTGHMQHSAWLGAGAAAVASERQLVPPTNHTTFSQISEGEPG